MVFVTKYSVEMTLMSSPMLMSLFEKLGFLSFQLLGLRALYSILSTWYSVLGTWFSVLGTRYSILGIWCSVGMRLMSSPS